ncbi:hypothetical protein GF358_02995 [Candidatus Woesearchaeota archaeon]|nr:hypothetical protein [Candidatus Woesearchaeota archaeon]
MGITQELLEKVFSSLDIRKYKERPWLKRDYEEKMFIMPIDYIVRHLDTYDKMKVFGSESRWQERKKNQVRKELEKGKNPDRFAPVSLTLHARKHEFRVRNGISRIAVFKEKKIPLIKAVVLVDEW